MIIEIRKAGFINKGAELMLLSAYDKLKNQYPNATFVMEPSDRDGPRPFQKVVNMGFFLKLSMLKYGVHWGDFAALAPKKIRERYGIVLDKEIDVVIDCAGFSYTDQWGARSTKNLARSSKRWKKRGTKVILLPQAFGPFRTDGMDKYVNTFVKNANLIFPRDEESYKHLVHVTGELNKINRYPDFTNLIPGVVPEYFDMDEKRVALIPNYRMIDKTHDKDGKEYIPFMIKCARILKEKQANPFVLIHDTENDLILAQHISQAIGGIPIKEERDPFKIKGIIGACDAIIGSRFHAIVSALSQGVPSLGTSWSHKYRMLFEEYDFIEGLVETCCSEKCLYDKIDLITGDSYRTEISMKLTARSEDLKNESLKMWGRVFELIEQ